MTLPNEPRPAVNWKINELLDWKGINNVNRMISQGNSVKSIYQYITASGFPVSYITVDKYIKLRKQAITEHVEVRELIAPAVKKVTATDETALTLRSMVDPEDANHLRSELDVLDLIVERGWNTIRSNPDEPMPISATLAAIKLKNELTNGAHNFLTNYGLKQLKETEANKYNLLMRILFSFIPDSLKSTALSTLDKAEDAYYQTTEYYEDYLRSRPEMDEADVQTLVGQWKARKAKNLINIDFEKYLYHTGEE